MISVHPVLADWDENAVTWLKRTASISWSVAGGEFGTGVATQSFASFSSGAWVSFDLPADLVKGWIDVPAANRGLIVKTSYDSGPGQTVVAYNTAVFASSEDTTVSLRPKLELTYAPAGNVRPFACLTGLAPDVPVAPAGQDITLAAGAGDADGSVTRVDFYADGTCLGSDSSAPYSLLAALPEAGSHTFTAVAVDDTGVAGTSTPVTVQTRWPIYSADMSSNPGWPLEGSWAYGQPTGADGSYGYPDPSSGFTGANVIGYNLNGPYGYLTNTEYATTPAINCTDYTNVQIEFQAWLGVMFAPWDRAFVEVSTNGGTWISLWDNPSMVMSGGSWNKWTLNLSAVADRQPAVYVRWGMGPATTMYYYEGWNIDDVLVSGLRATPLPDANANGMVDAWETYYFGGTGTPLGGPLEDKDGDGFVNLGEFIAGTNPTNAASHFELAAVISNALLRLSCPTVNPGPLLVGYTRTYDLESCTNLVSSAWAGIPSYTDIASTAGQVLYTNNLSLPTSCYRGRVKLQ